ncbi:MAG: hypothetical protein PHH82_04705 [Candidatus ainarchaeum sp.]|nr:hypothetical protein [Candidatus ainarchaeum sp.]
MLVKYKQGLRGWDDIKQKGVITQKLINNIEKDDFIDVANLSMMLYFINEMQKPIELKDNEFISDL